MLLSAVLLWQLYATGNDKTYFYLILTKFGFSQQIFIKVSDIKFHKKSVLWELSGYMQADI
jgi:hypothetical protein